MKQIEAADAFDQIADFLELKGDNPFRIRAYRRAALNLRNLTEDLEGLIKSGSLETIPGVGKDLAAKIQEIVSTGRLKFLENLKKEIPESLSSLMTIPGIGPKTAKRVYDRFKVKSIQHLEDLVKAGKLRSLPGFQEKKEQNILRGIQLLKAGQERMLLGVAMALAGQFIKPLKGMPEVQRVSVAGSLRRCCETIGDLDILVTSKKPAKVMDRFVSLPLVAQVQAHGETKSSIRTAQGVQVDLRVVEPDAFGAALVYFTGSKAHNIRIRSLANRLGLTINEYGVFKLKGGRKVAGREEEDVYKTLGLPWIPPELREDLGELEAAAKGRLPRLVEMKDLKGDFHIHSDWSDGHHPIEDLARAAKAKGYRYMLLSDHSKSLRVAGGLTESELLEQMREVQKLNRRFQSFRILMGAEVDILPDGRMDYSDSLLAKLDLVIAAVHSAFKQPKEAMTRRVIQALTNRYVTILAHPTARLIGEREPIQLDMEEVCKVASRTGTALEINCYTQRLDLNDAHARQAKELGAKLVLSTDTHSLDQLNAIGLGLAMARRAWVEPKGLLNTLGLDDLLAWVSKKRNK
ncbi:MAG: DNA polymerase/3'-5' exonuclease PolX [Candidatus Omnitrophica bacterium]|nr:DNA polymerase/3'-5' exonuclease PolX [Candidatus Omnitrophota bacterium]